MISFDSYFQVELDLIRCFIFKGPSIKYRSRFFDQVRHQTTSPCIENKQFRKICTFKVIFRHQKSTESF